MKNHLKKGISLAVTLMMVVSLLPAYVFADDVKDCGEGNHVWNKEYTVDQKAACAADGEESIHCSVCDKVDEDSKKTIPATGHNFEQKVIKEATCTENGEEGLVCTNEGCDVVLNKTTISATGHKYGDPVVVEPTCTEAGTSTKTCTVCGNKDVTTTPVLGHDWESEKNS
ncbi:hypothetical protein [Anaerofustis stercorihominis]|uniref:hypothetical protein n=1 Tax=Anaerofustis stercorihominis TaxID=214853 RepID=UPI002673CB75|nr:hypothetical protein [Anaerofustis stercorihominis]